MHYTASAHSGRRFWPDIFFAFGSKKKTAKPESSAVMIGSLRLVEGDRLFVNLENGYRKQSGGCDEPDEEQENVQ